MDKFSFETIKANLENNPEEVTIQQLLIYVTELSESHLPTSDKRYYIGLVKDALTTVPRQSTDLKLLIEISKKIGPFDYDTSKRY